MMRPTTSSVVRSRTTDSRRSRFSSLSRRYRTIIRGYTREAGVRNLEREIGAICRKVARKRAEGSEESVEVTPDDGRGNARCAKGSLTRRLSSGRRTPVLRWGSPGHPSAARFCLSRPPGCQAVGRSR